MSASSTTSMSGGSSKLRVGEANPLKEILGSDEFTSVIFEQSLKRRMYSESERGQIDSLLKEFLDTYALVGYDINGRLVSITNAKTEMQEDALFTAISRMQWEHTDTDEHFE